MSPRTITMFMTAVITGVTTAVAQTSTGGPPPAASKAAVPAQSDVEIIAKKLCDADPIIGTRIPVRRRCSTPAELAEYQRQAREIIENYRQQPCVAGTQTGDRGDVLKC